MEDIIAKVLVENNVQHCVVLAKKIADALNAPPAATAPVVEPVAAPVQQEPVIATPAAEPAVPIQNSVDQGVDKTASL